MKKERSLSTGMSEKTIDMILAAIYAVVLIIVAYPLYYVLMASFLDALCKGRRLLPCGLRVHRHGDGGHRLQTGLLCPPDPGGSRWAAYHDRLDAEPEHSER